MSGYREEITLTVDNLDDAIEDVTPLDMRAEIVQALMSGCEARIEYRKEWEHNQEATYYVFFPRAGRGGVCEGGNTDWTDCDSLDDLAERFANYEEQWSN